MTRKSISDVKSLLPILILSLAVGCSSIRRAQEAQEAADASVRVASTKPTVPALVTLPELVDFALTNRPAVRSARLAVEDARLRMKEIAANAPILSTTPWNAVDVAASIGYSESGRGEHFSDIDFKTERGKGTGAVSVDLLIYDFGRNAAEAKAQAERVVAAEVNLLDTGFTVFRDVVLGVVAVREATALREVAETNVVAAATHLELAEKRASEGEAKKLDVLQAKLTLAQAIESLVSASNSVVTARADLVQTVGGELEGLEDFTPEEMERGWPLISGSLAPFEGDFAALAETNSPTLKIARARVRAASHDVDRAIADLYPTLSASTSLSWTDPLWYFRWGVSGAQSLFTGFRKTTAVDRSVLALETTVSDLNEAELNLTRDLELALAVRENAHEIVRTAENTARAAEENLAVVNEQYRIGEASRVDFADALKALTQARGDIVKAEATLQRAESALYLLLGVYPNYL